MRMVSLQYANRKKKNESVFYAIRIVFFGQFYVCHFYCLGMKSKVNHGADWK